MKVKVHWAKAVGYPTADGWSLACTCEYPDGTMKTRAVPFETEEDTSKVFNYFKYGVDFTPLELFV